MMKMHIDSLEAVEEPLRQFYIEDGSRFKLNVDGLDSYVQEASAPAIKRANKEAIEERKKRQAWEAVGKSPEEIAELLKFHEHQQISEAEKKGEWDKLKEQILDQHRKELAKKDEAIGTMRTMIQSRVIDAQAVQEIAAEGGAPALLLPHIQRFVRTDENYSPIVVDASGTPRVDAQGNPMTIRALIKEMKASEEFGRAFNGSGQSGGGTPPGNGGGGIPQTVKTKADIYRGIPEADKRARLAARSKYVETHGAAAYFALPG